MAKRLSQEAQAARKRLKQIRTKERQLADQLIDLRVERNEAETELIRLTTSAFVVYYTDEMHNRAKMYPVSSKASTSLEDGELYLCLREKGEVTAVIFTHPESPVRVHLPMGSELKVDVPDWDETSTADELLADIGGANSWGWVSWHFWAFTQQDAAEAHLAKLREPTPA